MDAVSLNFRSRWVLVTGASSGLGREIARQLAGEHGANVIAVARRMERLESLKAELEARHGVQVQCIQADLTRSEDVERVFRDATRGREVYAVVLNAGVTHFGEHRDLPWSHFQDLLATNVSSVVRLTTLFVSYLIERDQAGGILLVASMAGLVPIAYQTAYSSSKAFVITFGRGLYHELESESISITTVAPGGIATEMGQTTGLSKTWGDESPLMQGAEDCAREVLAAFSRRDYLYVPGRLNRLQTVLLPWIPRRLLGRLVAKTYRKALATRDAVRSNGR